MKLTLSRLFTVKATGRHASSGVGDSFAVRQAADEAMIRKTIATAGAQNAEGDHTGALASIDQLLARCPDHIELLAARGTTLYEWGRAREALDELRRCAALAGGQHETAYKLGWACLVANEPLEALHWMGRARDLNPAAKTRFGLAVALEANRFIDDAIVTYREALADEEGNFAYLIQYGLCLMERGELVESESVFRRAIAVQPENPVGWTNLGVALSRQRRATEALAACEHADRLEASIGECSRNFINLAVELSDEGRLADALEVYERHLPTNPSLTAHFGYAGVLLRAGRMQEGWIQYEYRRVQHCPVPLRAPHAGSPWAGQDVADRTILVEAEQGFGDAIQFARYAILLKSRGAKVILRVPPELERLAAGFQGVHQVIAEGDAFADYDFHAPMLSLPRVFGTNLGSIPGDTPYLRIDERRSAAWRERICTSQAINIGIAWAGNPNHTRDEYRSIALAALASLGRVAGVRFVSLQKMNSERWGSAPPPGLDLADVKAELHDFEDTAALIDGLDLVISVDTAVLHLAGALGKPTWALLTAPPDFRWTDTGDTTPWYPTMRLFRQRNRGDWLEVIDRVSKALERACVSRRFEAEKVIHAGSPIGLNASAIAASQQLVAKADYAPPRLFVVGETRYGMMQYLPDDLPIGKCLDQYGEYLQHALELLEGFLRPGMVIVESASGIGAHSVPMARIIGTSGHLILLEEEALSRRVLQHNLRIAGATNVTVLPPARGPQVVDDLGLRQLDLFKVNQVRNRGILQNLPRTLETLRPAVFLESGDPSNFADAAPPLQALDYDVRTMRVPYFDANNFLGRPEDVFQDQATFVFLAIPREREWGRSIL